MAGGLDGTAATDLSGFVAALRLDVGRFPHEGKVCQTFSGRPIILWSGILHRLSSHSARRLPPIGVGEAARYARSERVGGAHMRSIVTRPQYGVRGEVPAPAGSETVRR
ncbi:hypothetical protein GCM10010442_41710 [Kitasatospora kifunensis]